MSLINKVNNERRALRREVITDRSLAYANNRQLMMEITHAADREKLGLLPHSPDRILAAEHQAFTLTQVCVETLIEMGWPVQDLSEKVRARIDWRLSRRSSYGGVYRGGWRNEVLDAQQTEQWGVTGFGLSLRGSQWAETDEAPATYKEYPALCSDPEIGDFDGTGLDAVTALIAHEVSHCAFMQMGAARVAELMMALLPAVTGRETLPPSYLVNEHWHSYGWQSIYRTLRIRLGLVKPWQDYAPIALALTHKSCEHCGTNIPFNPKGRSTKRFCSSACRNKAARSNS